MAHEKIGEKRNAGRQYKRSFAPCTNRVWKGILGIRDLTKRRHGNRENDNYFDGIRDLTAPRELGLAKIWAWDAGFFACSLGIREIVTTQINFLVTKAAGVSFQTKL